MTIVQSKVNPARMIRIEIVEMLQAMELLTNLERKGACGEGRARDLEKRTNIGGW